MVSQRFDSAARLACVLSLALLSACRSATRVPPTRTPGAWQMRTPIVIAHRGASGHRPEHTLEAYRLAITMGADFIEPDLVATKDGILVARHENEIGGTTDVAEKFPTRRAVRVIDGDSVRGWFTEDFTLAELRTLRAKERLAARSHAYDGQFLVPTFAEVLQVADSAGRARGRPVGVYPELKHPTYFRAIGLPLEDRVLSALRAAGLDRADAPVFVQCFEADPLRYLRSRTRVRLVFLSGAAAAPSDSALRELRSYADAIGVNTRMIVGAAASAQPNDLVVRAHAAGLAVHVWTLRSEPAFLAARYNGDPAAEVREFARLGVDGMFGDFPDVLVRALGR